MIIMKLINEIHLTIYGYDASSTDVVDVVISIQRLC